MLKEALGDGYSLHDAQKKVIMQLVEGKSTLYIDRTGAGKSAAYFLAIRIRRQRNEKLGPAIVVSPLISLMNDQVRAAERF